MSNTEENRKTLYIIGACCWLMQDLLSDAPNMDLLRRLKEVMPNADYVATASLHASKVVNASAKYEKGLTDTKCMRKHYPDLSAKELAEERDNIINQFALSSDYLYNWLSVAFKIPSEKFGEIDGLIQDAINVGLGKGKTDVDIALEWLSNYPKDYIMRLETVRNKLIEVKNRKA